MISAADQIGTGHNIGQAPGTSAHARILLVSATKLYVYGRLELTLRGVEPCDKLRDRLKEIFFLVDGAFPAGAYFPL